MFLIFLLKDVGMQMDEEPNEISNPHESTNIIAINMIDNNQWLHLWIGGMRNSMNEHTVGREAVQI